MSPFKKLRKERRGEYRVDMSGQGRLVLGSASGPVEATILDVSAHGCGARVGATDASAIKLGESLPLRVRIGNDDGPQLFLRGRVRTKEAEGRGAVRLGVQFEDIDRLFPQLREEQWRYFNRRSAFRVPPTDPADEPVVARVRAAGSQVDVQLPILNLSDAGIAFDASVEPDALAPGSAAHAEFELPGRDRGFELALHCVHRTPRASAVRLGLRLEEQATPDVDSQRDAIADWVVERQRAILARV